MPNMVTAEYLTVLRVYRSLLKHLQEVRVILNLRWFTSTYRTTDDKHSLLLTPYPLDNLISALSQSIAASMRTSNAV